MRKIKADNLIDHRWIDQRAVGSNLDNHIGSIFGCGAVVLGQDILLRAAKGGKSLIFGIDQQSAVLTMIRGKRL